LGIYGGVNMVCTFFGHRNTPETIKVTLRRILLDLIENKKVKMFYVGNNGTFDRIARELLKEFKKTHKIDYYVVLAYIPQKMDNNDYTDSNYFDELNSKPYKVRIVERNKLMIKKSDIVVTYVTHITGGAAEFKALAERKGKIVINIS
jgi:hypothetical protein